MDTSQGLSMLVGESLLRYSFGSKKNGTPDSWDLHSWKLPWNTIMKVWKMNFLCRWLIFSFHVNFPGCSFITKMDLNFVFLKLQPPSREKPLNFDTWHHGQIPFLQAVPSPTSMVGHGVFRSLPSSSGGVWDMRWGPYRGHCTTNPNNALYKGIPWKLPYVCTVWSPPNK